MTSASPALHDVPRAPAFVTVLTGKGRGAVAVLRVWGGGAVELVDSVFRPFRSIALASTKPDRLRLGRIGRGLGDEVVAVVLEGPPSPVVEVHCHGGTAAIDLVIEEIAAAGAIPVNPSRAIEAWAETWLRAQAQADLTHAPTVRTAEFLLEQAAGALDRELDSLIGSIEESPGRAIARLDRLIAASRVGVRMVKGWRVAITGRPNVGKSRLLNALAGYQRAIVDPSPGTTRDLVTVRTALDGWPVELVDTAGLRETEEAIERAGIELARREASDADLTLLVLDRSQPLSPADLNLVASSEGALVVASKSDLPPAWDPVGEGLDAREPVILSAEWGEGLDTLMRRIVERLVPIPPVPESAVPFREEHQAALIRARTFAQAGAGTDARKILEELTLRTPGAPGSDPSTTGEESRRRPVRQE